ncbi:hypothetical protein ND486_09670 [Pseudonocardia sp. DR1-2]|uniref:endonuclease domain-containing protein n=1 Tax=Pseudonocardia sp. DR1-2 TaxID=2951168 RepID=UPI002042E7C6|nr:hypothetical protein [Pseudonocardia sp. DR1-2]MCM3846457.1 hypothetical protein [Pseudonocardia sp. DR1-2]
MEEPFRGSEAVARGIVTPARLRGPRFVRLFPDVYVSAAVPMTPVLRARAASVYAGPLGAASAYSAAEILGASCGPWTAPAELVAPRRIRPRPDLLAHQGVPLEPGLCDGVRVTSPRATAWALCRRLELVDAVVALDALAARRRDRPVFVPVQGTPAPELRRLSRMTAPCPGFDPADLLALRSLYPHVRGSARLDRIVALADPRAESPPETRLRLLLVLSGLPVPQVQFPLYDARGRPWARFDLAYPDALLAVEYDGAHHDDPLDRRRDTRTAALGWQTLRITADGLTRNARRTVGTIRALLAQRTHLTSPRPAPAPRPRTPLDAAPRSRPRPPSIST